MTPAEAIRHNASIIRARVRGKARSERWNIYACIMLGYLAPIVQVSRVWRDGNIVFNVDHSETWARARNR